MKKARKSAANQAAPPARRVVVEHERLRPWLLLVLAALAVARPLLPSEGAAWVGDGQPFVVAWLALAAGCFLWAAIHGRLGRPLDVADAAIAVLVVACAASGVLGMEQINPRYSMNMICEWAGLGLVFFLCRQLLLNSKEARALAAVMIALAVVTSGYGLYQVYVTLPVDREAYLVNPDSVLRRLGSWSPPGSPERMLFENRLMSTEPMATFALTNSLAGFLAPWLVLLLGIGWSLWAARPWSAPRQDAAPQEPLKFNRFRFAGLAGCAILIAYCLALTKSRSAYLALTLGLALLPCCNAVRRRWLDARTVAIAAVAVAAVVAVAAFAGGLDVQVLTEAKKSLGYRLEYWQSTLAMIARYPWLGVGPGNFQDYYTQFKLPEASEEIRDPHNFLLEVWATAGTFAMMALVGILGLVGYRSLVPRPSDEGSREPAVAPRSGESNYSAAFIVAGGLLGFPLAFIAGPPFGWLIQESQIMLEMLAYVAVVGLLWPWIAGGQLWPRLPALGALVLAVHLLASGGIAFPGVAGTFWMLLALALNQAAPEIELPRRPAVLDRWGAVAAVALCVLAAGGAYRYSCRPVLRYHAKMAEVEQARRENPDSRALLVLLLNASLADTWAVEPWMQIADIEVAQLERDPKLNPSQDRLDQVTEVMLDLRANAAVVHQLAGRWYRLFCERKPTATAVERALECARAAVRLYPNSPQLRAELATLLDELDYRGLAERQAEAALRLDGQTPHADKKLPDPIRKEMERLVSKTRQPEPPDP